MDKGFQVFVRQRAGGACEYCRLPETCSILPFHLDHIVAEQHEGQAAHDNIALACPHCNRYKGPNLTGIDPESTVITPLFHPRQQAWENHFAWLGPELLGLTPTGRATIRLLRINRPEAIAFREALIRAGALAFQPMAVHETVAVYQPESRPSAACP